MKNRGPLLVLSCYILFGVLPIYWKLFVTLNPYFILTNRVVWSLVFTLILLILSHDLGQLRNVMRNPSLMKTLVLSGILLVVNWGSYIVAVNTGHVIDASLAYFMNPIIAILIGRMYFREALTGLQKLSILVATLGILIAIISYGTIPWLALIIGGSFALYGAVKKTIKVSGVTSQAVENAVMLLPALLFMGWLVAHGQVAAAGESIKLWQLLLVPTFGIVSSFPLVIYAQGIRTTSYSLSGILMYINPTLQLLCGLYVFHETFTRAHMIMFAFVWVAIILYMISTFSSMRKSNLTK